LIKSPIQNICDIVLHNTDAEGWVQFAEDEFLSVTMFEKPPWTNGNAQRLGDKPPFKEGGMSAGRRHQKTTINRNEVTSLSLSCCSSSVLPILY
jgi:hypothetical protein